MIVMEFLLWGMAGREFNFLSEYKNDNSYSAGIGSTL
jgi:hypothetical protein